MDERASIDGVYLVGYQQPGLLTTIYEVEAASPDDAVEIASHEGRLIRDEAWEADGGDIPAFVTWTGMLKQESDEIWPSWATPPTPAAGLPPDWEADYQYGPQGAD